MGNLYVYSPCGKGLIQALPTLQLKTFKTRPLDLCTPTPLPEKSSKPNTVSTSKNTRTTITQHKTSSCVQSELRTWETLDDTDRRTGKRTSKKLADGSRRDRQGESETAINGSRHEDQQPGSPTSNRRETGADYPRPGRKNMNDW